MTLVNEIINDMLEEKEVIEELIKIDNEIMEEKRSFDYYLESFVTLDKIDFTKWSFKQNVLFITEGNPAVTLDILRRLDEDSKCVIFINQNFVAMNKWLINKYNCKMGNDNVVIDITINYNEYINSNYKVIPLGENGLIDTVLEDFYD